VRPQVDREDVVPQLRCCALQSIAFTESHVGHHAVEPAEISMGLTDEPFARIRVSDVGDNCCRGGSLFGAQIRGEFRGFPIDVDAGHACTLACA